MKYANSEQVIDDLVERCKNLKSKNIELRQKLKIAKEALAELENECENFDGLELESAKYIRRWEELCREVLSKLNEEKK